MIEITYLYTLIFLSDNICLVSTQDNYNNYNTYNYYVDDHNCGWTERFCSSTNTCKNVSEVCDGKCGRGYHFCHGLCLHDSETCNGQCGFPDAQHFCPFNDLCLFDFEACDGQCKDGYRFCPSADSFLKQDTACNGNFSQYDRFCASTIDCIPKSVPCDGKCPEDYPNLCDTDNGGLCYPNSWINNRQYDCQDKSDEYRPSGEPCRGFDRFCPSTGSCIHYSEPCDGQCVEDYQFCSSTNSCIAFHTSCDGNCSEDGHFCALLDSCIPKENACGGNCPEDYPNMCDNKKTCYPNSWINDRYYHCDDRSDEYRPTGVPCGGFYRFCPSNGLCLNDSEPCDGQCGFGYQFCSSNSSCLRSSETCDGECRGGYDFLFKDRSCLQYSEPCDGQHCGLFHHFCPSTKTCIDESIPCDQKCPDDYPNLCDNATVCYPNYSINDRNYDCKDRSDEHHLIEEDQLLQNSSVDKFLHLKPGDDEHGFPGLDCKDGTVHAYRYWCKEQYSRMCGNVSSIDFFVCHNSSLWRDHPCETEWVRGCKLPGKCIAEEEKCNSRVGRSIFECGSSDYSDETCRVNEDTLKEHTSYFRCKDNSSLIHPTLVCDGHKHCDDLSDEDDCNVCPRVNNIEVHNQVVQLKAEEIRDLTHLKITAIMKCQSPHGQSVCATPGDGIPECAWELKEGLWQTQDEEELTSATLWRTIFKYMSYIFLISVVVLFKTTQISYFCKKPTDDLPILKSYHRTISLGSDPLPLFTRMRSCMSSSSFPTPIFTTTDPVQLTHQFRQYYIQNHRLERVKESFNFCLTLSQFLSTKMERDIFLCGIYALEAQIHDMSPTFTDRCLKQHSSSALEPMFDAVYGSISDKFPNGVKNVLFISDKILCLNYLLRLKTFLFRYFFFYYDIVQEYVLLSFILGTAGLGVSSMTWLQISDFDYIHIIVYLYVISVFLPMILFSLQLAFSSKNSIIFGVKNPTLGQKIFFGMCCFTLFPFIPTVLFFRIEKLQMKIFKVSNRTSKALSRQSNQTSEVLSLENEIVDASKILMDTNTDITKAKTLYKQFKEWELAIEMPIQSTLTIIFSFMKKSTTVVNNAFQNWFISDTKSLLLLIGMSLRSIIAVQISDESARRNNFLGIKSKMLLAPLYMMTSIPRIASIVIYAAVPLGLMDLLGHWTVERQGNRYYSEEYSVTLYHLTDCTKKSGYSGTFEWTFFNSTVFSADAIPTKYTAWDTSTYMAILMAVLGTSIIINLICLCFRCRKSFIETITFSTKSVLCITIDSDFDEDDDIVNPNLQPLHYKDKFSAVHKEYILKLLLHTGINMVITFPWALAYHSANKRHQLLMEIGDCLGVKGTVELEDISLERLWWGQWVLPLVMAILGVMNYGWFRLYVKYGHPWRRLLISDDERIEEWKTLKLWEILENHNDN